MGTNYRGFGGAWLALWLCLFMAPAMADGLTLGELSLVADAAWRRASADEEAEADSLILRSEGVAPAMEVLLPRQRIRLKVDAAKFFEQLEDNWRRRHGEQASLDWLEAGGVRWRLCRRPSLSGEGQVLQAVAVHGGEAYQLVAVVPGGTGRLPEPLRTLLAGAVWGAEAAAVRPAMTGGRWRLLRQVVALPTDLEWGALAEAERALLGGDGLVTGLGLSARAAGLEGFLEGFVWKKGEGAGEYRQALRRDWRVQWPSMPERWLGGEALGLNLDFHLAAAGSDAPGDMVVRFELRSVCAPRKEVVRWLDAIDKEGMGPLARVADMGCVALEGGPEPVKIAAGAANIVRQVSLPLPLAWERGLRAAPSEEVRRLVLIARFMTSESGGRPGDALLRRAAAVFVFGPDV